ncbi:MAG: hypothetical protein Q9174_004381 [Haloplaca sp. 1 TL-2023]
MVDYRPQTDSTAKFSYEEISPKTMEVESKVFAGRTYGRVAGGNGGGVIRRKLFEALTIPSSTSESNAPPYLDETPASDRVDPARSSPTASDDEQSEKFSLLAESNTQHAAGHRHHSASSRSESQSSFTVTAAVAEHGNGSMSTSSADTNGSVKPSSPRRRASSILPISGRIQISQDSPLVDQSWIEDLETLLQRADLTRYRKTTVSLLQDARSAAREAHAHASENLRRIEARIEMLDQRIADKQAKIERGCETDLTLLRSVKRKVLETADWADKEEAKRTRTV